MDLIARTVSSADINDPNMADDAKKDAMMDAHTKTFKMSRDRKEQGMLSPELYERLSWNSHYNAGKKKGLEIAKQIIEQGIRQGEEMYSALTRVLLESGRLDDLKRTLHDVEFRRQLYKEFGIERPVPGNGAEQGSNAAETDSKPEENESQS